MRAYCRGRAWISRGSRAKNAAGADRAALGEHLMRSVGQVVPVVAGAADGDRVRAQTPSAGSRRSS